MGAVDSAVKNEHALTLAWVFTLIGLTSSPWVQLEKAVPPVVAVAERFARPVHGAADGLRFRAGWQGPAAPRPRPAPLKRGPLRRPRGAVPHQSPSPGAPA